MKMGNKRDKGGRNWAKKKRQGGMKRGEKRCRG